MIQRADGNAESFQDSTGIVKQILA